MNTPDQKTEKVYGIVEGFFSSPLRPWTPKERLTIVRLMAKSTPALNTYFYCPKDDPYVARRWRQSYPQKELSFLAQASKECRRKNIRFVYGFNPGFDLAVITKDPSAYQRLILARIQQLQSIGVTDFCLLYDDIPYAYTVMQGTETKEDSLIGTLQAQTVNVVFQTVTQNGGDLWFCPTDYFFTKPTAYLRALNASLDPSIKVIWTGKDIFVRQITSTDLKKAKRAIGSKRPMLWWNNYPVNDCEHILGTFHIGAFNLPPKSIRENLAGVLMNPMREAGANAIAVQTFSQALLQKRMNPGRLLQEAFCSLFGKTGMSWYRVYAAFSDKNCVDDQPRSFLKACLTSKTKSDLKKVLGQVEEDLAVINSDQLSDSQAFFATPTNVIVEKAKAFTSLLDCLLNNKPATQAFLRLDTFPVVQKKRYFTKQYRVLSGRVTFTESILSTEKRQTSGREMKSLVALFERYRGKSRLTITTKDDLAISRLLRFLIKQDQTRFLQAIATKKPREQIHAVIKRQWINGY